MVYHSQAHVGLRVDPPTPAVSQLLLEQVKIEFVEAMWDIPADFLQRSHFDRVVMDLQWQSSPGWPYMKNAPTNEQFFKYDQKTNTVSQTVSDYMWELVSHRIHHKTRSDPVRLLIKPEPHKVKKLRDHKYRLISAVSVADQIIDHMLFDEMNEKMIKDHAFIPSKAGWSPLGGGWKHIPKETWVATDKTAWDWTVRMWLVEMVLKVRTALCKTQGTLFEAWKDLAAYRYHEMMGNPHYILSNGYVLKQRVPGVQKSGCVNTIADNSLWQWILHARICIEMELPITPIYTMGDDVLQKWFKEMKEYLERTGQFCLLKTANLVNEFAGFRFLGNGFLEPMYKGKHAFVLRHANPDTFDQLSNSYALLYHRSVDKEWMRDCLEKMGAQLFSEAFLDSIYDGMESHQCILLHEELQKEIERTAGW